MIRVLYLAIAILAFIELYSVGVMMLAKKAGESDYKMCLIPFYAFYMTNRLTGTFAVLTIPVKKFHGMMAILAATVLGAALYACWGDDHLPTISAESLWQIMGVVIGLCAFLAWFAILASSRKLFRRFNVDREKTFTAIAALVITAPILYAYVAKTHTPRLLKDMY
ncbi:MAG: hypothetical protein IJB97_02895 [Clostridia bacterium]|nr:hypothetical protein [Clostridia bacterium]